MRIDAITTCAGPLYAAHFARSLPIWLETLDSLTVATDCWTESILVRRLGVKGLRIIATDAFTKHGAHFNKGAALNEAHAQAIPQDWVLSIDCDVIPPPDWREHLKDIEPGYLYGCGRHDRKAIQPCGYFQLWHASDAQARPFAECYGHAGRYDTVFAEQWPPEKRRMRPFTVEHLGEPATHWHGEGNEHLTKAMLSNGVAAYRARDRRIGIHAPD